MAASKSTEDFWNTTFKSSFNFDEDDEDENLDESFTETTQEPSNVLSIHHIISKTSLDLLLDDIKSVNEQIATPIEETIKKMVNGHKYVLEHYRKLDEKLALLDASLETHDGNVIINVILFLKRSLKSNIFYMHISKRKVALRHYMNYLMLNNEFQGLTDLYMTSGNIANMKELCYLLHDNTHNPTTLYKKLDKFTNEHLYGVSDKHEIDEYMNFLQWQINHNENCSSLTEQLAKLCKQHFSQNKTALEPLLEFKKQFKIDDFAFEWTLMNVLASLEMYQQISDYFIKTNWLTKKNLFKSSISAEVFLNGLSKHKPPEKILSVYLPFIGNSELRLYLAQKYNCYKFVIQTHINQEDRLALIQYRSRVPVASEEFILIEDALQSNRKWKN